MTTTTPWQAIYTACTDDRLTKHVTFLIPTVAEVIATALTARITEGDRLAVTVDAVVTDALDDEAAASDDRGGLRHTPSPWEVDRVTEAITVALATSNPRSDPAGGNCQL